MQSINILGVKIDNISLNESSKKVKEWLEGTWLEGTKGKYYIVTPNPEFLMLAQKDYEFKEILNKADLAIPDGTRLAWAYSVVSEKNPLKKLLKWSTFLLNPASDGVIPTTTGVDLMEELIRLSQEKGYSIGLLGGREGVALKLKEKLEKKYPGLKVTFASDGGKVDPSGTNIQYTTYNIPPTDLLFVAFGHGKQEKWIAKNLDKYPVKVMMGVGGSFDYLSGEIKRAPQGLRNLGFEWLFRLILQPWRIKRFFELVRFVFLVLRSK
jgi:N-acetylglucosaminyldiphosphoundecaprenol N-acetyl-beta-D-mannosaminyltransferase